MKEEREALLKKKDLVKRLARRHGCSQPKAEAFLMSLIAVAEKYFISGGDRIVIRGFGTLKVSYRKSFVTADPLTGERITYPAQRHLVFKPSRELTSCMNS